MKYLSVFILLFCISLTANAQSNYRQGYIITNSNDTIRGFVDFQTDNSNSSICKFRLSEKANEQIFYPGEINGYMFTNEVKYYVSRKIDIEGAPKSVFLEYLVQGMKDLYYYPGDLDYYLFEDENGKMIAITKKPDQVDGNEVKEDVRYRATLNYIFKDCNSIANKVDNITFARSSMIELTKKYHAQMCTSGQECIVFQNDYKKRFIKIELSLYAGVQSFKYSFGQYKLMIFDSAKSTYPVLGAQMNIFNPRSSKSLSLQLDFSVSKFKGDTDHFIETDNHKSHTYQKFKLEALMTTARIGFKYTYPEETWRPTIEAGFSYMSLSSISNSHYYERKVNDLLSTETTENYATIPNTFVGFYSAAGLDCMLKNTHTIIFCRIGYEQIKHKEDKIKGFTIKAGYTF